jgi:hypothetical protein
MAIQLYLAALLVFGIGIAHSYLGERYILVRLFRRKDLPKLFGSDDFTVRTLRLAWHLTTVAWWGLGAILIQLANPPVNVSTVGFVIGTTFILHFAVAIFGSRGKHLSWLVFLAIGVLAIYATRT